MTLAVKQQLSLTSVQFDFIVWWLFFSSFLLHLLVSVFFWQFIFLPTHYSDLRCTMLSKLQEKFIALYNFFENVKNSNLDEVSGAIIMPTYRKMVCFKNWHPIRPSEFMGVPPYLFRQNAELRFCLMSQPAVRRCLTFVVVHHRVRQSYISRTFWPRITKFDMEFHTDLLCSHTRHDMTNYFRAEVIAKKRQKCHLRQLQVEFLENGFNRVSHNFTRLSGTVHSAPQTYWIWRCLPFPVGCKMHLKTVQQCVKYVRPGRVK